MTTIASRSVLEGPAAYPGAPAWADVRQVAEHTGLGVSTIRRYVRSGVFPSHKIGSNLLLNLREVDARISAAGAAP